MRAASNLACLYVHADRDRPGAALCDQKLRVSFAHQCGQQAIVYAIRGKNIAKARGDDDPDAIISQSVDRRFARGPTAKIAPPNEDADIVVTMQWEIGARGAIRLKPQIIKQKAAIALGPWGGHEPRRDKLICVDIFDVESGCQPSMVAPSRHVRLRPSNSGRTSVRCPVTAAAATIAGDIRCVRAPRPWRP